MSVKQSKGFTLIELIIGIVVIAIVTLVVTGGL
ncbi:MAG TPA: pili assembly chaperone, partial [Idiomarina loihiensis]|nr:pili assembly chaperone [Idiomarina loihiensis]